MTPNTFQKLDDLNFDTLKKILDNSYDEIFVIDKDQTILYVNPVCQANYGLTQDEIIGKKAYELIDEGYCYPSVAPEVLRKKTQLTIEQSTIVGKKLICTATPVFNHQGDIELIVENSRDVTQLESIKQNLEDAQALVKRYKEEVQALRRQQVHSLGIIARDPEMRRLLELSQHVAPTDSTILILGESGTGKGMLAKYLHRLSPRKDDPFITINCAAIPDTLLESELFGYESGAFTGARKEGKLGRVELANGGTLFLDEIAEVPLHLQSKLLEVIQERRFVRVGGNKTVNVDVRIVSATNRNIKQAVKKGLFRDDLFYRLSVVEIEIPPLRERSDDIMPLVYRFLDRYDKQYKKHHTIAKDTLDLLLRYDWPGNVREVEHLMERLVVTVPRTTIRTGDLPEDLKRSLKNSRARAIKKLQPLDAAVQQVTGDLIRKAYAELGSSYKVARALKTSQSKANRLIRRYITGVK